MARVGIRYLAQKKLIKPCGEQHAAMLVYTGTKEAKAAEATDAKAGAQKGSKKGGKAKEEAAGAQ